MFFESRLPEASCTLVRGPLVVWTACLQLLPASLALAAPVEQVRGTVIVFA